jgi:hypothetical protein
MRFSLVVLALASSATLFACSKDSDKAAPAASAASGPASAAAPSAPVATTSAAPAAAAAPAAVTGIKSGEIVAALCDTVAKDSECAEFVVMNEADKAKTTDAAKKLCPTAAAGSSCPNPTKIVATCRVMKDIINHYYSEGGKPYTKDTAKAACSKNMGHLVE